MITAIVFIHAEVSQLSDTAAAIADIDGVSEVYSVTGDIDLVAMVRVAEIEGVSAVVADRVNQVPGVVSTQTQIAYRAYSKHDLEEAFSLGF